MQEILTDNLDLIVMLIGLIVAVAGMYLTSRDAVDALTYGINRVNNDAVLLDAIEARIADSVKRHIQNVLPTLQAVVDMTSTPLDNIALEIVDKVTDNEPNAVIDDSASISGHIPFMPTSEVNAIEKKQSSDTESTGTASHETHG
jgi:hypothetical protein